VHFSKVFKPFGDDAGHGNLHYTLKANKSVSMKLCYKLNFSLSYRHVKITAL